MPALFLIFISFVSAQTSSLDELKKIIEAAKNSTDLNVEVLEGVYKRNKKEGALYSATLIFKSKGELLSYFLETLDEVVAGDEDLVCIIEDLRGLLAGLESDNITIDSLFVDILRRGGVGEEDMKILNKIVKNLSSSTNDIKKYLRNLEKEEERLRIDEATYGGVREREAIDARVTAEKFKRMLDSARGIPGATLQDTEDYINYLKKVNEKKDAMAGFAKEVVRTENFLEDLRRARILENMNKTVDEALREDERKRMLDSARGMSSEEALRAEARRRIIERGEGASNPYGGISEEMIREEMEKIINEGRKSERTFFERFRQRLDDIRYNLGLPRLWRGRGAK